MFPTIKQYNIDYEFLISNYLNKELWKKKWNLFVYKDNVFTLNLYTIHTKSDSISFEINYNKLDSFCSETITYYLNNTTIKVLKQQINGAIFRLMERYDEQLCRNTDGYREICRMYNDECDELREIAKDYLDDCGVTQDDIREVYIDRYVSDNTKCDIHKSNYVRGNKYKQIPDMFLVFTKITDDKNRYNIVVDALQDYGYIERVENEIKEFKSYFETNDYKEEMIDNLSSI